jgi:hypothetical protein
MSSVRTRPSSNRTLPPEEAREETDRLRQDEAMLDSIKTTVVDLHQLRSEIDGRKIRLQAVDDRIGYAKAQMLRVEDVINAVSRTTPAEPTTLEELAQIVKLRRLRDLHKQMANSIELLNHGRSALLRRLALLEERLAMAQARSQIASFEEAKELAQDPGAVALRQVVTRLVDDSVRWGTRPRTSLRPNFGRAATCCRCRPIGPFYDPICGRVTSSCWASTLRSSSSRHSLSSLPFRCGSSRTRQPLSPVSARVRCTDALQSPRCADSWPIRRRYCGSPPAILQPRSPI